MAAPHQNIADIVVLKTPAPTPDTGDLDLDSEASTGLKLAAARKAKNLTHADVNAGTKIKIAHIAAIETGDRAALPATPFTAGFIKAYAQFLGLDADAFARAYKQETGFVALAAPALTAIMREAAKARADERRADEPTRPAAHVPPSQVLNPDPAAARSRAAEAPGPAGASTARGPDADKMVTWLGAGAVIAVIAFLAGRAVQPDAATSEIAAPPSTVIAAAPATAPAPLPVIIEPAPPVAESAPPASKPVDPSPALETVKPPVVKPKPKKTEAAEAPPAPEEITPAPVLIIAPATEAPPAEIVEEAPPAPPEPTIVPAKVTRPATPLYPERCAVRAGEKVAVSVVFSITAQGKPVAASVAASDNRCFNSAAQRAVYDMRFSPRTIDGVPAIETGKSVTVQFVR